MLIQTVGKPNHISLKMAKEATRFYAEYLMPKIYDKVFVTLEFKKFQRGNNDYAYCDAIDDGEQRKRDFVITLDARLNKKETLLALAHEMVHVKQYAKGELKDLFRPTRMVRWQGERFDPEDMDYWELPYEIEAYGREKGLYVKFMTHLDEKINGYISV